MSSDAEQQLGERAIVIGADMGGLMAAGMLDFCSPLKAAAGFVA